MKFKDWFDNKLLVGAFPYTQNNFFKPKHFDIVINVSDEFYSEYHDLIVMGKLHNFWFPMNECKRDIGLNSIYGAMIILYNAELKQKRVYLHCHAGVNRSRIIEACYYYMRTGKQLETNTNGFINRLCASCTRGYLPPLSEMQNFLRLLGKYLELYGGKLLGCSLDEIKLETIRNF